MIDYLMIVASYFPFIGGVEKHVYEINRSFEKMGLDGKILVLKKKPATAEKCMDIIWMDGGKLLSLRINPFRLIKQFQIAGHFMKAARIHFHDFATLIPFLPLLTRARLLDKTFLTFHGWEGIFPPEKHVIVERKRCEDAVKGNICIGDFIPKWYNTKADIISYGGVDTVRYTEIKSSCGSLPQRIAYIGRFENDTGLIELINGFRNYKMTSKNDVELHLFGAGSLIGTISNLISGFEESIKVFSSVQDIMPVLERYPVIFASGYLTILESLCARRVVLAYYNNSLREDYLRLHPAANSMFICGTAADVTRGLVSCFGKY